MDHKAGFKFELEKNAWWNAAKVLATVNLQMLKQFKQAPRDGVPIGLTENQWETSLNKMICAFHLIAKDEIITNVRLANKRDQLIEDGLIEYAANFMSLWD